MLGSILSAALGWLSPGETGQIMFFGNLAATAAQLIAGLGDTLGAVWTLVSGVFIGGKWVFEKIGGLLQGESLAMVVETAAGFQEDLQEAFGEDGDGPDAAGAEDAEGMADEAGDAVDGEDGDAGGVVHDIEAPTEEGDQDVVPLDADIADDNEDVADARLQQDGAAEEDETQDDAAASVSVGGVGPTGVGGAAAMAARADATAGHRSADTGTSEASPRADAELASAPQVPLRAGRGPHTPASTELGPIEIEAVPRSAVNLPGSVDSS